ncbi:MAG: hypothetical protein AB8H80_07025 [Planctomycetota bacterium]
MQIALHMLLAEAKPDRYDGDSLEHLRRYLHHATELGDKPLFQVERGALRREWLDMPANPNHRPIGHAHDRPPSGEGLQLPATPELPASGYTRIDNSGEGYFSHGWMFDPSWTFDQSKLDALLLGLEAERVEAVFITDRGVTAYNMADGVLTKSPLDGSLDSRVEVLRAAQRPAPPPPPPEQWLPEQDLLEQQLLGCVISRRPDPS